MKRLFLIALLLCLSSCSATAVSDVSAPTENTTTAEPASDSIQVTASAEPSQTPEYQSPLSLMSQQELYEALLPCLEVYDSALGENFNVELTNRFYPDFTDENYCDYFSVTNYSSRQDIIDTYTVYLDEELFVNIIDMNFETVDGVLYFTRGGRGYGYAGIDTSGKYLTYDYYDSDNNVDVVEVRATGSYGEVYDTDSYLLEIETSDDGYRIVGSSLQEDTYPDYEIIEAAVQ